MEPITRRWLRTMRCAKFSDEMILFQSKRKQELSKKDPAEQAEAFQNLGLKLGSLENLANLGETLQLDVEIDRFSGDFTTRA